MWIDIDRSLERVGEGRLAHGHSESSVHRLSRPSSSKRIAQTPETSEPVVDPNSDRAPDRMILREEPMFVRVVFRPQVGPQFARDAAFPTAERSVRGYRQGQNRDHARTPTPRERMGFLPPHDGSMSGRPGAAQAY